MQKYQKVSVKGGEAPYLSDHCLQFFTDPELNLAQQPKPTCNFSSRNCWILFFKEKKKKHLSRHPISVLQNEDGSGHRFPASLRSQLVKQSQKKFKYLPESQPVGRLFGWSLNQQTCPVILVHRTVINGQDCQSCCLCEENGALRRSQLVLNTSSGVVLQRHHILALSEGY